MDTVDLLSIISIAFLGSVGHCIGMCGGIVIAYSNTKIDAKMSSIYQSLSHLIYSLGRVTTYTVMGAVFGAIGGVVSFSHTAISTLTIIAGIFMVLTGLSILGWLKFLTSIEHSFSKSSWYQDIFRSVLRSKSLNSFYILGLLNGLLPCGLVYFFAVTAASTGSAIWGAVVMMIFGLSTIPSLFALGLFSALFSKNNLRKVMMNLASIVVIAYGFYTIYRGYDFIQNPNKSLLNCCEVEGIEKQEPSKLPAFKEVRPYSHQSILG